MFSGDLSPFDQRRSGILLHPTSLPGNGSNGVLGHHARRFAGFLQRTGFSVWQTLPLGPTHEDLSPYNCLSVFACDSRLICFAELVRKGWLKSLPQYKARSFEQDLDYRNRVLQRAWEGFSSHAGAADRQAFERFVTEEAYWLDDYALYTALRTTQQRRHWVDWPAELKNRQAAAMEQARRRLAELIAVTRFEQFLVNQQWLDLKQYANQRNILMFGDIPMFVAHDSAEVWARRDLFTVDAEGRPETVAGVPPDYFSEDGQLWGNPLYRWDRMQEDDFAWWVHRFQRQLALYDLVRIDHFRGFEAYWEVDSKATTAKDGHWVKAPGDALFQVLKRAFPDLPMVAEDLGVITPEVERLRKAHHLPGMKVLQFGFDGKDDNMHLPHNYTEDCIAYTGTHDNNTTVGWFDSLHREAQDYVMSKIDYVEEGLPWSLIRTTLESIAIMAIIPLQDAMALGEEARMNVPGVTGGNWRWRFHWEQIDDALQQKLLEINLKAGRVCTAEEPSQPASLLE